MKFFGELLIFVLLFITNLRVFFVNSPKRDPLVAVAPFTFLLAILQIFAWGLDLFTALGFVISLLVLLSNFHAMFRYSERLYVDHYSVLMRVWAIFTDILSFAAIVILFIFAPVDLNAKKINVYENISKYNGDFSGGFSEIKGGKKTDAFLYEYSLGNLNDDIEKSNQMAGFTKNIVLFVPDKRGDTDNYKPFLQLLAGEGYTVCSADFYARDCKWFHSILDSQILRRTAMITDSLIDNIGFNSQREFYTYNLSLECKALKNMLKEKYGDKINIFIITDGMGKDAVSDFAAKNKDLVKGYFSLDSIPEYKTSGYGCVAQTSPIVNKVLGYSREKDFKTPRLLVSKAKEVIKF